MTHKPTKYSIEHIVNLHLNYVLSITMQLVIPRSKIGSFYYLDYKGAERQLLYHETTIETNPLTIGWHMLPWASGGQPFAIPGNFFAAFCCCFIFVLKERSSELNLRLSDILENLITLYTHVIHSIVISLNMK